MKMRRILLYELLILVPTLVAGGVLFRLLGHERERLERAGAESAAGAARLAARSLDNAVAAVQDAYATRLLALPPGREEAELRQLADRDPLVRNVFRADPRLGLLYPRPENRTEEERLFALRYDALFSGREPFRVLTRPDRDDGNSWDGESLTRLFIAPRPARQAAESIEEWRFGWIPWFWESRLHWLGWSRPVADGPVYGLELETSALLAYLLPALPSAPSPGTVLVLRDGNGQPVHQWGAELLPATAAPAAAVPVGPGLPHWTLEAYAAGPGAGAASGRLFTLLSTVLTLTFMAALLAGGGLLALQARRDRLDAERKTTFVSNVSHEFKTPLTTLRMYAELLAEGRVNEPDTVRRYLAVMIRETERLTRLVNNVLDFSRLEQGRRRLNPERIDAAALALAVLEEQAPRLKEAGLETELTGFEGPAPVRADRDALSQILLNLVDNAVKYAGSGKHLFLTLNRSAGRLRLIVEDRGTGVPLAHRARLFEPFQRGDDSLTAARPGTGLGLHISRRLLRDMGGDLLYEPAPGGGARFILELPDENQDHPDR